MEDVRAPGTCGPSEDRLPRRWGSLAVSDSKWAETGDDLIEVVGRDDVRNGKEIRDLREVLFMVLSFAEASCRAVAESLAILRKRSVPLALSVDEASLTEDKFPARKKVGAFAGSVFWAASARS